MSNRQISEDVPSIKKTKIEKIITDVDLFNLDLHQAYQDNADYQYTVGCHYSNGKLVEKNLNEAMSWFYKSAIQNYVPSQYCLGIIYMELKNFNESILWLKRAKDSGHVMACFYLGIIYYSGYLGEVNYLKSIEYFEISSTIHVNSQYFLANSYYFLGNIDKAIKWYTKASENKCLLSCFSLGILFRDGIGVKKDYNIALHLIKLSAQNGYNRAQDLLGDIYSIGEMVKKDISIALYWYKEAAHNGFIESNFKIDKICNEKVLI